MNKYLTYIYIIAKNTFSTKKKLFAQTINHIIFMVVAFYLYRNVYLLSPGVSSRIPLPNAIWSMAMYFVMFWLGFRNFERAIREDIKSGNVEIYFLRPIGYIKQKILNQIGEGIFPFLFALITSIITCYLLVGWPMVDTSLGHFMIAIFCVFILSQILTIIMYVLCGLSAFWLQDSEPIYFVVSKLIMIFGNAWVPVAFFPSALRTFAEYSPFGASMAFSYATYPNFMEKFGFWILINIFWIIVLGIFCFFVSKRAYKKLSVNG